MENSDSEKLKSALWQAVENGDPQIRKWLSKQPIEKGGLGMMEPRDRFQFIELELMKKANEDIRQKIENLRKERR